MKKILYLFACIIMLSFTACQDKEETEMEIVPTLDGRWQSTTGSELVTDISGTNATFYSFGSSNYATASNLGYVQLGDLFMKEITQINSTTWAYHQLYMVTVNGVIDRVEWTNTKGSITLSSDGNTITTVITGNNSTTPATFTYTKVQ